MKKLLIGTVLALLTSNSFALITTGGSELKTYDASGKVIMTVTSLPTVIVDDVVYTDLASEEALAEIIAGNEAVASLYAEELGVSVEAILESAANMDDFSVESLQAGLE